MKLISLTQGLFAQVDDWNYDWLNQWKWHAFKRRNTFYAARHESRKIEGNKYILMHRIIMNTSDGMEVDHRDHNGLNCLEENMRNCTHQNNTLNVKPWGRSKYLGVYWYTRDKCWRAQIKINGKRYHLGYFKEETDAAKAYDRSAHIHHGEFANLNFK